MKLSAMQRHDKRYAGMTVALVRFEGKSEHWPKLPCQPCVHVELNFIVGIGRDIRIADCEKWQADCFLELADYDRTQWSLCWNFNTREEAATEAAAFVKTAKELLWRSLNGEAVITPVQRREETAQRAWEQSAELADVERELSVAREAHANALTEPARRFMQEEVRAAERVKYEVSEVFLNRFHGGHHWSEFAGEVSS